MEFDFGNFITRNLASLDQKLGVFKEYYFGLDEPRRKRFRKWISQLSKPLPDDFQGYCQMLNDIGCTAERVIGISISVDFLESSKGARTEPQLLKQAVDAWDRGEEFVLSEDWYLA